MTNHRNDERTVRCPVDGCDATPLARGINLHLRRSSGNGHGPQGDVPDHINTDTLETVGEREVEMDYPEERDTEAVARLCPYCSTPFQGHKGVLIHLSKVAGRNNHPADAADRHDERDFPRVEVDDDGNITRVFDNSVSIRQGHTERDTIPVQRVYHLIAELLATDHALVAQRVRTRLLGTNAVTRPVRQTPPHQELYQAVVSYDHTDDSGGIAASLDDDGITVSCRGETAVFTPDEAKDMAAGIEQTSPDNDEVTRLVAFLRYGADLLSEDHQHNLPMDFEDWR